MLGVSSEVEKLVLNNIDNTSKISEHDKATGFSSWVKNLANNCKLLIEEEYQIVDLCQVMKKITSKRNMVPIRLVADT